MARAAKGPATKDKSADEGNVIPLQPRSQVAAEYQPSDDEAAAVARCRKRKGSGATLPQMKCEMKQTGDNTFDAVLGVDHPDKTIAYQVIADALNTGDMPIVYGWLREATGLGMKPNAKMDMEQANYGIAIAAGIKPRDTVEMMLALQMAAVHIATMKAVAGLSASSTVKGMAIYEASLNKLGRTFTTQMEALKRHRSKGNQRIVVERVNVSEGGQAIVGDVHAGSGRG
ncbi:hypothetical protein ABMA32_13935 [Mesorhizobium sp. VNQ89]|uniref:hypothetical protein n=1 Tax=Mesorhizobium quangtriensis TaxID=3157709 RepID=UPI0032B713EF